MDTSLSAALGLGFVLGLRHALDADHVAAVSAMATRHSSVLRSCLVGTFWGAGHTASLLAAALGIVVFRFAIPPAVERAVEAGAAAMLVVLGAHALVRATAGVRIHRHAHVHDGRPHSHLHVHAGLAHDHPGAHAHAHRILGGVGVRPFLVGLVHGLAGSAALMLLAVAAIPSVAGGLLYVLVFGAGATIGMLALSAAIGVPIALSAGRWQVVHVGLQGLAGSASLAIGLRLLWAAGAG
jgi:ABC-type nickel/cobalt efflux system permease component RcnA